MALTQRVKITPTKMQQKCIDTLKGPVMVLAGPGTGKTFTVIERIKSMLSNGIKPDSILCLTFSDPAANEMKTRLVEKMGSIASRVSISTYHAFCNDIIQTYPSRFELLDDVSLIDDITKYLLVKECIGEFNPEFLRTKLGDPYHFIKDISSAINEIKQTRISKEVYFNNIQTLPKWQGTLEEIIEERKEREAKGKITKTFLGKEEKHLGQIGKAKEIWAIFELYEKKLKEKNFIDFNDMINLVVQEFEEDESFLKTVAKHYEYFLVDEYQDTNANQNQLVFNLAKGANNDNVFVVGDDDQIIFGFMGAQTDNLENFLKKYPDTTVICLDENRRSTQTILDLGYKIISKDSLRLENKQDFKKYEISKKLIAKNDKIIAKNKPVELLSFDEIEQENLFIIDKIEALIKENNIKNLDEIAILVKHKYEIREFENLLKARNIPFQVKESKTIFEIKPAILIYFYLKALFNKVYNCDTLFGLLLSEPFNFEKEDYNFLLSQQRLHHKDFITLIQENLDNSWKNKEKVTKFIDTFNELNLMKNNLKVSDLIVLLINKTGILEYFTKSEINKFKNIAGIRRLIEEAYSFQNLYNTADLKEFIEHLDLAYNADLPIQIKKDDLIQNAIQLTTLHSSKGREFEYVFMPHLTASNLEKKRPPVGIKLPIEKITFSEDEEESKDCELLRLLFVGITRAKHDLFMSYANSKSGKPLNLTKYLDGLSEEESIFKFSHFSLTEEQKAVLLLKVFQQEDYDYHKQFKEELSIRAKKIVLSPSAIRTYDECARKFLYQRLYNIPILDDSEDGSAYGSAMHETLASMVSYAKQNEIYPTKDEMQNLFVKKLNTHLLTSQEKRDELLKRGKKSIENYYHHFIATPISNIKNVEYKLDKVPVGKYFVQGFADRIEINSDGEIAIYDYKTSKPVSQKSLLNGSHLSMKILN